MIERGKFRSLTLINWNGIFARTFDLDELVTTLSGGNGAGKSTTLAAVVTALIPDLTLLHFRNTTEAGATSGSREKGLHGKLKAGVWYSMRDTINSRHQRVVVGVRLQQVAGRDRKVDIKPFAIQGLPMSVPPTQLVTETLTARQARGRPLNELTDKREALAGVQWTGKFRSLTLINWNGFFARTFDLDELVTTLSGGNGAGKSTTMAAFVTALIPDLTLLHFRNTTEAGATSGSRDKGLHGKLKAGVCYSMLDTINSRHQRVVVGVRLQQVAGRDRKVDIKPFAIQGLPMSVQPTQLVTETLNERQARVLPLNELKDKLEAMEGVQFTV